MTFLFSIPFLPNMQSPKSINVLGYNVIHITCCYLRKQHTCRENNFCYIEGVIYKAHQIKTTQHNNILRLFTLTILLSLYQCFPSQLRKEIKRLCCWMKWQLNWRWLFCYHFILFKVFFFSLWDHFLKETYKFLKFRFLYPPPHKAY